MKWAQKQKGFTIVELLIVVVVIAILAAITIVAYNGIQRRAVTSRLQNTVSQVVKKAESVKVLDASGSYPATQAALDISVPSDVTLDYFYTAGSNTFCAQATGSGVTYSAHSQDASIKEAKCSENGLIGWWRFNGNANDSSGNNLHGTVTGAALTTGQGGQANGAYTFDGVDDTINFGNSALLTPTNANSFSVSAWYQRQGAMTGEQAVIRKDNQYQLGFPGTTSIRNLFGTTGGTTGWVAAHDFAYAHTTGVWYHGMFVWDGVSLRSYVNGVLVNARPVTGLPVVSTATLSSSAVGRYFEGKIDDIRIYGRALSDAEAVALYSDGAQ